MKASTIFIILLFYISCTTTPNETAIGILWDETPSPTSTSIMVVSDLEGENLRMELINDLNALGFIVDHSDDQILITESRPLENSTLRLIINLNNSAVVITGEKNDLEMDGDWQMVERGDGTLAAAEWKLMEVVANSLQGNEILYN